MKQEIWKDVVGYEGLYQVSNFGRVRKIEPVIIGQGGSRYKSVWLKKNNEKNFCSVHRLVAQAFIPNPENKKTVNHINGIKSDNRVDNLEWATYSENIKHALNNNLIRKGKKWLKVLKIKDGEIIKEYRNIKKAAIENNIEYNLLRKIVNKTDKKYLGFEWVLVK